MRTEILVLLAAAVWTLAIVLPSGGSRSERQAEQQLCLRVAAQVKEGDTSLAEYLATRCAAKLLTGADKATERGGQR
ncbi:MAG: hypothetical protein P3W94_000120 [Paracoccus sp. (in: a-proteobacteria)]|nr:hypothetical protein [Paracoccus sp. (in: a-proteobacteria)]